MRALIDLLITIAVIVLARAILTSVMRGFGNAARTAGGAGTANQPSGKDKAGTAGELHKDPVCGTYVAGSTAFRQQINGQTYYYCSDTCREKHSLVRTS